MQRGASVGSVADSRGAQESACHGRQVAKIRDLSKNRRLRTLVLVVHVEQWAVPMSSCAVRARELAQAP